MVLCLPSKQKTWVRFPSDAKLKLLISKKKNKMNSFYSCLIDEVFFRIYFDLNFLFNLQLNPVVLHIFTSFLFSFSHVMDKFHEHYKFKFINHFLLGFALSKIAETYSFVTSTFIHFLFNYFLLLIITVSLRIIFYFSSDETKKKLYELV
jgi:hypothetical protein